MRFFLSIFLPSLICFVLAHDADLKKMDKTSTPFDNVLSKDPEAQEAINKLKNEFYNEKDKIQKKYEKKIKQLKKLRKDELKKLKKKYKKKLKMLIKRFPNIPDNIMDSEPKPKPSPPGDKREKKSEK
tara:strand:+ start:144 stop:527 length:384 start_codon:yes stop_codon:yes gene_type:complete